MHKKIIKSKIIKILKNNNVRIDSNQRTFIYINKREFKRLNIKIKKNKEILINLLKYDNNENFTASLKNYSIEKNFNNIKEKYSNDIRIKGRINKIVKGGVEILYKNIKCFLPNSLADNIKKINNKIYYFNIIKINKNKNVLLSRKKPFKKNINILSIGSLLEVSVKYINEYGIYVNYRGFDGLINTSVEKRKKLIKKLKINDKILLLLYKIDKKINRLYFKFKNNNIYDESIKLEFKKKNNKYIFLSHKSTYGLLKIDNISWINYFNYFNIEKNKYLTSSKFLLRNNIFKILYKETINNPWINFKNNYAIGDLIKSKFVKNLGKYSIFKNPFFIFSYCKKGEFKNKKYILEITKINFKKKLILVKYRH
ncbi:hypothetical protein [Candidatus Vidania fulgoroideorum]